MDNKGQASAEFILLFGGIIVVVLLAVFFYKTYLNELSGEIESKEVRELNDGISSLESIFK